VRTPGPGARAGVPEGPPEHGRDGAPVAEALRDTATGRLSLRAPVRDDALALHERVWSDPRTWRLDPALRSGTVADTARHLDLHIERWRRDGLGSWVLREAGDRSGDPIGLAGCSVLRSGLAWNLAFRLQPACWGRGLAQEVSVAAIAAARRVRPDLPVTAVVAGTNAPSLRVLERSGLVKVRELLTRRSSAQTPTSSSARTGSSPPSWRTGSSRDGRLCSGGRVRGNCLDRPGGSPAWSADDH